MSMILIGSELFPVYNYLWSVCVRNSLKQLQWAFLGMSFSFILTSNIWMISWINVIDVDIYLNNGVISSRIIFKTISCSPLSHSCCKTKCILLCQLCMTQKKIKGSANKQCFRLVNLSKLNLTKVTRVAKYCWILWWLLLMPAVF